MRGSRSFFKAYKRAKILEKRRKNEKEAEKKIKLFTKKGLIWKRQIGPIKSKHYLVF
jgi:hypothetical protein